MSQGFTPGSPTLNSLAVSQIMRDDLQALLTQHAGAALPLYATEGMSFFDDVRKRLTVVKPRASKAYGSFSMGGVLTLHVVLAGAGQDGSTIPVDLRVQNNTLLLTDKDWNLSGGLNLRFNYANPPSYFAGKQWGDPVIGEPLLTCADGILTGKNWDALVGNETIYVSGQTLQNEAPFAAGTLRAIDIEEDAQNFRIRFLPGVTQDHIRLFLPTGYNWSDVQDQDWPHYFRLFVEDTPNTLIELPEAAFKARPYRDGGVNYLMIYRTDPAAPALQAFGFKHHQIRIRKPS